MKHVASSFNALTQSGSVDNIVEIGVLVLAGYVVYTAVSDVQGIGNGLAKGLNDIENAPGNLVQALQGPTVPTQNAGSSTNAAGQTTYTSVISTSTPSQPGLLQTIGNDLYSFATTSPLGFFGL